MLNALVSTEAMTRDEWLKWRNKGIGGSDASIICGVNKYKSAVELWMEKTGQIEPREAGEAAYWGTILEPIIREEFTKRTGLVVGIEKSILQHPYYPFMLANLDGMVIDSEKKCGYVFEAKTANPFAADNWELDVPEGYQLQVQHYMAVTGCTGAYIAVLIGGNQFKFYFIERDEDIITLLIKLEKQFWDCVVKRKPPKLDGSKASSELLSRLYPKGKSKDIVPLPEEALGFIRQYEDALSAENEAVLKKEEAVNHLKDLLGDNQYGSAGGRLVAWTNVSSERFDAKTFKAEQPEIYSKYVANSNYRRFTIR